MRSYIHTIVLHCIHGNILYIIILIVIIMLYIILLSRNSSEIKPFIRTYCTFIDIILIWTNECSGCTINIHHLTTPWKFANKCDSLNLLICVIVCPIISYICIKCYYIVRFGSINLFISCTNTAISSVICKSNYRIRSKMLKNWHMSVLYRKYFNI